MKRFKTIISATLALSMMASVAACSDKKTSEETTTFPTAREEPPVEVTTAETTEAVAIETDEIIESEDESYDDFQVVQVPLSESYGVYMDLIDKIHNENPDTEYGFSFVFYSHNLEPEESIEYEGFCLIAGPMNENTQTYYFYTGEDMFIDDGPTSHYENGEWVTEEHYSAYNVKLSYEDIKALPAIAELDSFHEEPNTQINLTTSADDGEYMGSLLAYNDDHTKALVRLAKPVTLTKEEFESLSVGDTLDSIIDCSWIIGGYDEASVTLTDKSDSYASTGIYFINEWNGAYYISTEGDFYCTKDSTLVLLDLDPECDISENILLRDSYNGWNSTTQALMNSIIIENNTITGLTFRGYGC